MDKSTLGIEQRRFAGDGEGYQGSLSSAGFMNLVFALGILARTCACMDERRLLRMCQTFDDWTIEGIDVCDRLLSR